MSEPESRPSYSLWDLTRYMLSLGTFGFGGPVALVGYMHRDLVEGRRWISETDYKEGMALSQIAPGPLAAQLAIYLGYVHYGLLGATLSGIAFVLPSFLMVVAIGWAYVNYGGLPWMQAVFYGVGAAVIGIIAISAHKLTVKYIGKDWLLWGIFLALAAITVITESEKGWLFLAAGALVWFWRCGPRFSGKATAFLPISSIPSFFAAGTGAAQNASLLNMGLFFGKAGAFVFGSGLAIVPFLYGDVVKEYQWLTQHEFLDAVAVAMITPGPVVITVGFIGYLVAGFPGACVAALGVFLPCYLLTVIPAPYFRKYGKLPAIAAFVDGITAASVGAIAGSVVVLARRTITDIPMVILALLSAAALWRFKKWKEPWLVVAAALLGLGWRLWVPD